MAHQRPGFNLNTSSLVPRPFIGTAWVRGKQTFWVKISLGHSREISCSHLATTRTDLLIVPLLKTQYSYICAASALSLNTVIEASENTVETWPCLYINLIVSYMLPCSIHHDHFTECNVTDVCLMLNVATGDHSNGLCVSLAKWCELQQENIIFSWTVNTF